MIIEIRSPEAVGRRLRALRQKRLKQAPEKYRKRWSLRNVAARLGVNPATLSRLESGKFRATRLLPALADLYGVSVDYILTGVSEGDRNERLERIIEAVQELDSMDLALLEAVISQITEGQHLSAEDTG